MISTARSMHCPKGAISGTATIMLHLGMGIKTFRASLFPIASAMRGVTSPKMEWGITIGITPAIIWDFPAFSTMAFSPVAPSSAPAFSMAFVARALVPRARIEFNSQQPHEGSQPSVQLQCTHIHIIYICTYIVYTCSIYIVYTCSIYIVYTCSVYICSIYV